MSEECGNRGQKSGFAGLKHGPRSRHRYLLLVFCLFPAIQSCIGGARPWAKTILAAKGDLSIADLALDREGNLVVAGSTPGKGPIDFGDSIRVEGDFGFQNAFLAVYRGMDGKVLRVASPIGGGGSSRFDAVAVDRQGNLLAGGSLDYDGRLDFGNGVVVQGNGSQSSLLLVKFDPEGRALWARTAARGEGGGYSSLSGVNVDDAGNVYAIGTMEDGGVDLGGGVWVEGAAARTNPLLVKYDAAGRALWARSLVAANNHARFESLSVDGTGSIYVAGQIEGLNPFDFGDGVTVTGQSNTAALLVKYKTDGRAAWARTVLSPAHDSTYSRVRVSSSGGLSLLGSLERSFDFDFGGGRHYRPDSSGANPVLVEYGSDGTASDIFEIGEGQPRGQLSDMAVAQDGSWFAGGNIQGSGTFSFGSNVAMTGAGEVIHAGLVKYDSKGRALWAWSAGPAQVVSGLVALTADDRGGVYAAGFCSPSSTLQLGKGVSLTIGSADYTGVFVVHLP